VTGELDLATAPALDETLQQAQLQARLVVLDLRELDFMDSSGAHTIVSASLRARLNGGRLVVVRGRPHIDRVFVLTRSCDVVDILDLDPSEPPVQALLKISSRN
jgi:anti-sigma B factor antagonist